MRTLLVSDVHGNVAALRTVLELDSWDRVLCLGDLVGYGPDPAECVQLLRGAGATVVQGNHDRAVAEGVPARCRAAFQSLAEATYAFTRQDLDPADLAYLNGLPRWTVLDGSRRILLVHAAPCDPLYRYLAPDPELWVAEVESAGASVLLVGHTHLQFRLEVGGATVVNPGGVGQPKDGEPSAAFAVMGNGEVRLDRVPYAVEETVDALKRRGLASPELDDLVEILRTGRAPEGLQPEAPTS